MANRDSSTATLANATACAPIHQAFSWLPDNIKNDLNAHFAEMAMTIAMGAQTIATILRKEAVDQGAIDSSSQDVRRLLSPGDLDALTGLMVLSLQNLSIAAEERIDRLDFAAREGAK